jgi:hypothetical protein
LDLLATVARLPMITVMMRSLLLGLSLSAVLAIPASAQALPPGMKMHRVQAGEADASGWMLAESTEGGFSVRLPLKFNDFTLETDAKEPTLRLFVVGAKSQEGIKFTATRIVYRKDAESAKHFFSQFETGQGLGTKPERITPRRIGERPAVDIVLKRASDIAYQRALRLEADLLLMVLESPRAHEGTAQQLVTPFFDSVVVTAP